MLPSKVEEYLIAALDGTPDVIDHLLRCLTEEEADRRPDPARFTIREVMAHLADWEDVFGDRMARTRDEDYPTLQGYDEGQWAIDHDYANADWRAQCRLFRERRARNAAMLRALVPAQWDRAAHHTEAGRISLAEQAVLMSAHDVYHLRQIAAWRQSFPL